VQQTTQPERETYTLGAFGQHGNIDFLRTLAGKKIVLIGPSEYLMGSGKGSFFDKFDLIVRMNLSCPTPKKLHNDIGSRTDILYHVLLRDSHCNVVPELFKHHTTEEIKIWKEDGVKWVVAKLGLNAERTKKFASINNRIIPWVHFPTKEYDELRAKIGTAPNMGTIAITHMLQSDLKELHVYGCDFHLTGYYTGYGGFNEEQAKLGAGGHSFWGQKKNLTTGRPHKLEPQVKYLKKVYETDKRFKPDKILKNILGVR
jgi:hypothetical protein